MVEYFRDKQRAHLTFFQRCDGLYITKVSEAVQ
jgi:hypothetical protein